MNGQIGLSWQEGFSHFFQPWWAEKHHKMALMSNLAVGYNGRTWHTFHFSKPGTDIYSRSESWRLQKTYKSWVSHDLSPSVFLDRKTLLWQCKVFKQGQFHSISLIVQTWHTLCLWHLRPLLYRFSHHKSSTFQFQTGSMSMTMKHANQTEHYWEIGMSFPAWIYSWQLSNVILPCLSGKISTSMNDGMVILLIK